MKTYNVEIIETLSKIVEIQANNKEQAEQKAIKMYENEEIVLLTDDFIGNDFIATEKR